MRRRSNPSRRRSFHRFLFAWQHVAARTRLHGHNAFWKQYEVLPRAHRSTLRIARTGVPGRTRFPGSHDPPRPSRIAAASAGTDSSRACEPPASHRQSSPGARASPRQRLHREARALSALLVIRPSSLGDVVHALALVADVVRARPGTAIDWVAEPAFAELPALCPEVRDTLPFALRRWRHAPLRRETWREIETFRRRVRSTRYDVILDLQEQIKGGLIARIARGVRHGFDRASIREKAATFFDDVHHRDPRTAHFATRCRMLAAARARLFAGRAAALESRSTAPPRRPAGGTLRRGDSRDVPRGQAVARGDWRALSANFAHAGIATLLPWGSERRARAKRAPRRRRLAMARVPPRQSLDRARRSPRARRARRSASTPA